MIEFDNIQKSTLQSLRVTDIQIAALETNALLGIKFHLENPPKLSDIRDEFNDCVLKSDDIPTFHAEIIIKSLSN